MEPEIFDRTRLALRPLAERDHDMTLEDVLPLEAETAPFDHPGLREVAQRVVQARRAGREVIVVMGAHPIKLGLSRFLIDLMRRGAITCLGMNGAGAVHDFELALIGATTESVARYLPRGEFGLWRETGQINDIVNAGGREKGFGTALGEAIVSRALPHRGISILAAGYTLDVPVTVHVGIGCDIIHQHPNFDGGAAGAASHRDFLLFAEHVRRLEGGVFLCIGSAVTGPEVFQKALSMARNVERAEGRGISKFTTAVFDLLDLGGEVHREPPKSDARYYFRPYKTILVRAVAEGGESFYLQGDIRAALPALHREVANRRA